MEPPRRSGPPAKPGDEPLNVAKYKKDLRRESEGKDGKPTWKGIFDKLQAVSTDVTESAKDGRLLDKMQTMASGVAESAKDGRLLDQMQTMASGVAQSAKESGWLDKMQTVASDVAKSAKRSKRGQLLLDKLQTSIENTPLLEELKSFGPMPWDEDDVHDVEAEPLPSHGPALGEELRAIKATRSKDKLRAAAEIEALTRFGGESVVRLLDVEEQHLEKTAYIFLFLEAAESDLRTRLTRDPALLANLPVDRKLEMIAQILRGLALMNRDGWIHRDVRPENIAVFGDCMSKEGCRLKLARLESACSLATLKDTEWWAGSPRYIAPEVWAKRAEVEKMDVWAAGIIAFELLAGSPPEALVKRGEECKRLHKHPFQTFVPERFSIDTDSRFRKLKATLPQAAELVEGMLTKSVDLRLTAEQALRHTERLQQILSVGEESIGLESSQPPPGGDLVGDEVEAAAPLQSGSFESFAARQGNEQKLQNTFGPPVGASTVMDDVASAQMPEDAAGPPFHFAKDRSAVEERRKTKGAFGTSPFPAAEAGEEGGAERPQRSFDEKLAAAFEASPLESAEETVMGGAGRSPEGSEGDPYEGMWFAGQSVEGGEATAATGGATFEASPRGLDDQGAAAAGAAGVAPFRSDEGGAVRAGDAPRDDERIKEAFETFAATRLETKGWGVHADHPAFYGSGEEGTAEAGGPSFGRPQSFDGTARGAPDAAPLRRVEEPVSDHSGFGQPLAAEAATNPFDTFSFRSAAGAGRQPQSFEAAPIPAMGGKELEQREATVQMVQEAVEEEVTKRERQSADRKIKEAFEASPFKSAEEAVFGHAGGGPPPSKSRSRATGDADVVDDAFVAKNFQSDEAGPFGSGTGAADATEDAFTAKNLRGADETATGYEQQRRIFDEKIKEAFETSTFDNAEEAVMGEAKVDEPWYGDDRTANAGDSVLEPQGASETFKESVKGLKRLFIADPGQAASAATVAVVPSPQGVAEGLEEDVKRVHDVRPEHFRGAEEVRQEVAGNAHDVGGEGIARAVERSAEPSAIPGESGGETVGATIPRSVGPESEGHVDAKEHENIAAETKESVGATALRSVEEAVSHVIDATLRPSIEFRVRRAKAKARESARKPDAGSATAPTVDAEAARGTPVQSSGQLGADAVLIREQANGRSGSSKDPEQAGQRKSTEEKIKDAIGETPLRSVAQSVDDVAQATQRGDGAGKMQDAGGEPSVSFPEALKERVKDEKAPSLGETPLVSFRRVMADKVKGMAKPLGFGRVKPRGRKAGAARSKVHTARPQTVAREVEEDLASPSGKPVVEDGHGTTSQDFQKAIDDADRDLDQAVSAANARRAMQTGAGEESPDARRAAFTGAAPAPSSRKTFVYKTEVGTVVKEIHAQGQGARSARFELMALELLGGGDIVTLLDSTVAHDERGAVDMALTLEGADGNLLSSLMQHRGARQAVSMERKVGLLVEIMRGLAKMESAGYVHGEVTPTNLLLFGDCLADTGCHAKIGSLSMARPVDALDADALAKRSVGNPYAAPEVVRNESDLSKIDVWSAGAVALQLLTAGEVQDYASAEARLSELERLDSKLAQFVELLMATPVAVRPTAGEALELALGFAAKYGVSVQEQAVRLPGEASPTADATTKFVFADGAQGKVLVKEVQARTEARKKAVDSEIAALKRFGGGDIVRLLALGGMPESEGAEHGTFTLSLEAAEGTLREALLAKERGLLGTTAVPLGQKIRLLIEILRGLAKLQEAGWVHGNISPDSVLLFGHCASPEGCHAKLANLELARPAEQPASWPPSGPYVAPEARSGRGDQSKADVWSAGVLAYEMFTGVLPQADLEARLSPVELKKDPGFAQLRRQDHQLARLLQGMLAAPVDERLSAKVALELASGIARRHGVWVPKQPPSI